VLFLPICFYTLLFLSFFQAFFNILYYYNIFASFHMNTILVCIYLVLPVPKIYFVND
jgi:hypothetical protein